MMRGIHLLRSSMALALSNLGHRPGRTAMAVAGLSFAIILIFIQLGFLGSAEASATLIPDHLDFDIVLVSSQYHDFVRPGVFSRRRVIQAQDVPGVAEAVPVYQGLLKYRNPRTQRPGDAAKTHSRRNMMIIALNPADRVFNPEKLPQMASLQPLLKEPDTAIYDQGSRDSFVEPDGTEDPELGPAQVRVVGSFRMGTGFGADGLAVMSDATFCRLGPRPADVINLGLIRVDPKSGLSPEQVQASLRAALPRDVFVWTRQEVEQRQRHHWVWKMPIGIIFVFGTVVAVVVGVVFGYQVISSDIANRLREFATLKALGYTNTYLILAVVGQALSLAVLAFLLAFGVSWGLYKLLSWQAKIPMDMNAVRAVVVLVVSVAMCSVAAWLALGRVKTADPANLF